MLESNTGSNKKYKPSFINTFININSQNSYKDLIEKDKKAIRIKKFNKKKNKTMKGLNILDNIEIKEKIKYNKNIKYSLGEIKIALIHKEATKPLKKKKDLSKKEIKNNSCPCCGLPIQISGKLEDYKMCDNPDEFSNCGEGVILYFSFFKFCIIVTLIATILISFFDSFISYNYYYELQKFCDNLPENYSIYNKNNTDDYYDNMKFTPPHYDYDDNNEFKKMIYNALYINASIKFKDKCDIYSSNNLTTHKLFKSFFFKISLVNFRNYEIMSKKLYNLIGNNNYKSTIINLNFVNFLCLITIFIVYLVYTFFIFNKSNAANYLVYTVGNYSIFLYNLNDIYEKFGKNLKYIQKKEKENNNSNKKLDKKIYEDKLGFEPEENIPKLDLFKNFLKKKIFIKNNKNKNEQTQFYDIKRIDLCYKLNEIIYLQKEIEELEEKIQRIEFDQSMIEKNNKKGVKGDKRIYYSCCLCCKTEESLEEIKKKKKKKKNK